MVGSVVVKLSGSLIYPPNDSYLSRLREVLLRLASKGVLSGVVVGGGDLARSYIGVLRRRNVGEAILDLMGIEAARLNASLVAKMLYPHSPPYPPATLEEAIRASLSGLIPVLGGLQPGQSTNAVAAVLAEALGSSTIINALRGIDGVYDRDPREPGSRRLERISYSKLREIISSMDKRAGGYTLFDEVALDVVERSRVRVLFIDGSDPTNILKALEGRAGTVVGD